jgi:hypothetical protein
MTGVTRIFFVLVLLLILSVSGQGKQKVGEFSNPRFADSVEEFSACCNEKTADLIEPGSLASEEFVHEQGKFWDDKTYRLLKEKAKFDPNVPKGNAITALEDGGEIPITSLFKFSGNTKTQAGGFFPPDTIVAVGPAHIIEATNGLVRLSSKTNAAVQTTTLASFFNRTGKHVFDPKIYFDRLSNRFILMALEFDLKSKVSFIRLAVSQSNQPQSLQSGWCKYQFPGKSGATWADYPSIGMNGNWFVFNVVNFNFSNNMFFRSFLKVISKKAMVNNANSCPRLKVFSFGRTDSGNIQPVVSYTDDPNAYAIGHFGPSNFYQLFRVTGTTRPVIDTALMQSPNPYSLPPDAAHPHGTVPLDTGDNRILQAVFRDGKIHAVQTTGCSIGAPPNESCIRLLRINPTTAQVESEVNLGAGLNKFLWVPSIAVNQAGDVAIACQHSGNTKNLSAGITAKKASAPGLQPMKLLTSGTCTLNDLEGQFTSTVRNRTGDYTGAQTDPSDNSTMWLAAQFSKRDAAGKCEWGTMVTKVRP